MFDPRLRHHFCPSTNFQNKEQGFDPCACRLRTDRSPSAPPICRSLVERSVRIYGITFPGNANHKKCGGAGYRSLCLLHAKQTLYHLSYTPDHYRYDCRRTPTTWCLEYFASGSIGKTCLLRSIIEASVATHTHHQNAALFGFDHINRNAPVLIRTPKLTRFEPAQYWGGGPPGNSVVLNPFFCRHQKDLSKKTFFS